MPGSTAGFVGTWTVMMAAMMAPSVSPTVLLYAGAARDRSRGGGSTALFVAGYLAAWAALGAAVGLLRDAAAGWIGAWQRPLAVIALGAAGTYQLTRWKSRCLTHCRSPMHFFLEHWRPGARGALLMGAHHGLYCVGCCAGLMVALIALGLMSWVWMVAIASIIVVEKLAPAGNRLAAPIGVALMALGLAVALGWTPPALSMEGM